MLITLKPIKTIQVSCNHTQTSESCLIEGVEIKPLATHADSRGFFREIIRDTDPIFSS